MELPAKQVCIQNEQILEELYKALSEKVTSDQVKSKIILFLNKVKKLIAQIKKAIPPNTVVHYTTSPEDTIDKTFQYNTELLLDLVPVQQKTSAMKRLPLFFSDSIEKIVLYLQGDKSWLLPSRINSTEKKVGQSIDTMELSIEGHNHKNTVSSEIQTGHPPESKSITILEEDDLGYPPIYHALSRQTELNHILDPLFELLFPQNTLLLSIKHCKKTTGKSLNTILEAKLGQNEKGNIYLYKIITDEVLRRIFNDDRIISIFNKSLNVALLKVVIFTALYRLYNRPDKFPVLGGVSYFIDFEEEMLKTTHILEGLLDLLVSPAGSKSFFHIKSGLEREGLLSFLKKNKEMYNQIFLKLPDETDEVKNITKYWPPKFASHLIINSSLQQDAIDSFFSYDQSDEISQFLRHMQA